MSTVNTDKARVETTLGAYDSEVLLRIHKLTGWSVAEILRRALPCLLKSLQGDLAVAREQNRDLSAKR